jgi:hypothetical protein
MKNVVNFPKATWHAPVDKEDADRRLEEFKDAMLDVFLEEFVPFLLSRMNIYGIVVDNPKDIAVIAASIQSAIMRTQNRYHPLQQFADQSIELMDEDTVEST